MGYEHDMDDWYEEQKDIDISIDKGSMKFKRKNIISCNGVTFQSIIWNYICWFLAGKPDNWRGDGT